MVWVREGIWKPRQMVRGAKEKATSEQGKGEAEAFAIPQSLGWIPISRLTFYTVNATRQQNTRHRLRPVVASLCTKSERDQFWPWSVTELRTPILRENLIAPLKPKSRIWRIARQIRRSVDLQEPNKLLRGKATSSTDFASKSKVFPLRETIRYAIYIVKSTKNRRISFCSMPEDIEREREKLLRLIVRQKSTFNFRSCKFLGFHFRFRQYFSVGWIFLKRNFSLL